MTASCRRTSFALATIILAMGAAAPAQTPAPTGPVVRVSKTFGVSNAPPGPWDVYITLARLPAGFWTGPPSTRCSGINPALPLSPATNIGGWTPVIRLV